MKSAVKSKWISALRSGNYNQVTESLWEAPKDGETKYGACLLGVLADVAVEEGVADHHTPDFFQGEYGTLPTGVADWAELDDDTMGRIIDLNDEFGVSFDTFADLLETATDVSEVVKAYLDQKYEEQEAEDEALFSELFPEEV